MLCLCQAPHITSRAIPHAQCPWRGRRDFQTGAILTHRRTFFGPTITSVFFAASLISVNGLLSGLKQWPAKCKQDLISTWAAGLCFWPFVDLVVYSLLPVAWIPLGYNVASFFWTIYLSLQAARSVGA